MINVTVVKFNQNIITVKATGHSGYEEAGKDIVCSAVSTLMQTLIAGLIDVAKVEAKYVIDEKIPHLNVTISKDLDAGKMHDAQILMESTLIGLKAVRDEYSKFISIKEKRYV